MKGNKTQIWCFLPKSNWHEKKLNKEKEKVLLDLIDELIAELDITYTDFMVTAKNYQTRNILYVKLSLVKKKFCGYIFVRLHANILSVTQNSSLIS